MRYLVALIILITWCPGILFAQDAGDQVKVSSLPEAWDYALKNNQDMQNYTLLEEKALREVKIAKSYKLPAITGSFSGQKNFDLATTVLPGELRGEPGESFEAQFGREYTYNAGITISKSILDRPSALQTKIAQENVTLNQLESKSFEQSLKQQVAYYYYSYLVNLEALQNYREDALIADSLKTLTQQKFDEGLIDVTSLHQAEINLNLVKQNIYNTQIFLDLCIQQLKTYLGIQAESQLQVEQKKLSMEAEDFDLSLGTDPAVILSEKQIYISRLQVKKQKSIYLPNISLTNYWGQQQFRDNFGLSLNGRDWNPYNYLGINLQIPIFTGFSNKNKLKNTKTDLLIAEREFEDQQRKSLINDDLLIRNHTNYSSISKNALANKDLYQQKFELSDQKFKEGLVSTDVHLKAFEDYLNAEQAYLNALANLYTNYSNIISRQ